MIDLYVAKGVSDTDARIIINTLAKSAAKSHTRRIACIVWLLLLMSLAVLLRANLQVS